MATTSSDPKTRTIARLEQAWAELRASYEGLPAARLLESGIVGDWSVRDLIVHISAWEEEALAHLSTVAGGQRPPRYASTGGIDAFNARTMAAKRGLALDDVLAGRDATHTRLLDYLRSVPPDHFAGETRFRHRLRLDTFGHYRIHAAMIRGWRESALH